LLLSNPRLADLITNAIGEGWVTDLEQLRGLESFAGDAAFQDDWSSIKQRNKSDLAKYIHRATGVLVDPHTLFDVQAKRIHEYKRQHLNLLHAVAMYNRIKTDPNIDIIPRTIIFAGKAAPGYFLAKLIIKLITSAGDLINDDPDVRGRLKIVFVPDFNVKNAQRVYPAAEVSEQISTAGKEASGTGNMKLGLNGALTIGTLDGANIEIRNAVGADNFFLFGLTTEEIASMWLHGYHPYSIYEANAELRQALDMISSGLFSPDEPNRFAPLIDSLKHHDQFAVLADFQSYIDCQNEVSDAYRDRRRWTRMSILNVARMGHFSSDRAIREYCREIWNVQPS
jgi:glycogen phosphorylase